MKVIFANEKQFSVNIIRENRFDDSNADLLLEIRPSDPSELDDFVKVAKENNGQKITIVGDNSAANSELNGYILERAIKEYRDGESGLEITCIAIFKKQN